MKPWYRFAPLLIAIVIILYPIVFDSPYFTMVMVFVAFLSVLALSNTLLLVHAGVFSLAHPVWYGVGAYTTAILSLQGVPTVLCMVISAIFVAVLAYLMGFTLLRLKGYYLAAATFCLLIISGRLVVNMGALTNGWDGLRGIPSLAIGNIEFVSDLSFYILSWGLCFFCYWFCQNLLKSRYGRAIKALNDSETASMSMGINVPMHRLKVFVVTAVMASLVGSLYCYWIHYVRPGIFSFSLMVELITVLAIGGGTRLWGPILGCFSLIWLKELIHTYIGRILPITSGSVDALFFGAVIVIILIYSPSGLTGWLEKIVSNRRRTSEQISES